jgi:hypothetical protein
MLCSPRSQAFPNLFYAKMERERDSRADASLALPLKIEFQIHFQRRFTATESVSGRRVAYFNLNRNCEISRRAYGLNKFMCRLE